MNVVIHFIKISKSVAVKTGYLPYLKELIVFNTEKYRIINDYTEIKEDGSVIHHYNAIFEDDSID